MYRLLLALALLQPLLSFAQLLTIPILTTTLYAVLTPSISSVRESITFTHTFQQAISLLFYNSGPLLFLTTFPLTVSSLTIQQNSSVSSATYPIITPLSSTTITLRNSSSGDILLAPPPTVTKTKTGSRNKTVVGTAPRNTNIRYATSSTTTVITNSTTSANILSTSTPTFSTDISKISATSTKATGSRSGSNAVATGGARGRRENYGTTALTVWMAVALGGVGAGMMSWG
ncbi:mucin 12, cell surface associated [Pseudocyphellaria aurata]|nr:mucin 12, cell surface associated [Pseudocyphellaria aurata]